MGDGVLGEQSADLTRLLHRGGPYEHRPLHPAAGCDLLDQRPVLLFGAAVEAHRMVDAMGRQGRGHYRDVQAVQKAEVLGDARRGAGQPA